VRQELRSLARPVADTVARHLAAAGRALEEDPARALEHAMAARRMASRIAAVREAAGIAAYYAGEWQAAITELRTYHRISGRHGHLAMIADCERALGRPERAIDIYRTAPQSEMSPDEAVELLIVAAGARADLGQLEAAVTTLQVPRLSGEDSPATARLRYAYADALLAVGRHREAREWFARAAAADEESVTDAADRLLDLDGVVIVDAEDGEPADNEPSVNGAQVAEDDEPADSGEPSVNGAQVGTYQRDPTMSREDVATQAQPAIGDGRAGGATGRLVDAYDLVVLDLDGVVYVGAAIVPGAAETIAELRRDGPPVVFATNNASRTHDEVAALLTGLGVAATATEVLTSATAAAEQVAQRLPAGTAVLVVGASALTEAVAGVGLRPVSRADDEPLAVVQGYSPQVGWTELAEACVAIRAGAIWVATNTDSTLPSERGLLPGNGAMVAALRTALGRGPDLVAGKPQPALFQIAAQRAGASRPLVVGDRLDTDIDGARNAGMDSLLVLTGVDTGRSVRERPPAGRPTHLAADLTALLRPPESGDGG
jgi:glycerol-1-phosphatase